jgi:tetratricopeptide (TPR) repeat protein/TolB-like protein
MQPPPQGPRHSKPDETAVVEPASTFHAGDVLCERFRVERFIARGGMGELYAARDLTLGESVALKTIRPEIASSDRTHQRFLREIQLARKVTHPNICRIFDLFQHAPSGERSAPVSFVTMELLNGETLYQRLARDGRFDAEHALPLVTQMVSALSAAHAAGVVHRDLKSNNVMLLDAGTDEPPRVVVTDFGLAYSIGSGSTDDARVSVAGEILGTPGYMAPEQIEGGPVTPATDIYALGVVLYEMMTGTRPFPADNALAEALLRMSGRATPPRAIVPELPTAWNDTILRCLERFPRDRFEHVDDVVRALGARVTVPRWARHRTRVGLAAAVVLAAAGFVSWRISNQDPANANAAAVAPVERLRTSVAVLGFRNLAGREDTAWLSTALAEMLAAELAAGDSLRTIPGENVQRMKTDLALADADSYAAETLTRIRQNLGSDLVVSGSYVTVGGGDEVELRVDIRLQDSATGETVAVITETGRSAALFDLVSHAGTELRERLGVEPSSFAMASVRASLPASPDAARVYTEGLFRLRNLDALGARELLERAIEADPDFPLAHSALAAAWTALGYDNRAREAAERALALASNLPRAERLEVEAVYREMTNAWAEAIALRQSLSTFFPDDVEHVLRLANAQVRSGAPRDALDTIENFRARFPVSRDPRLDLVVARAAERSSDFAGMRAAAAAAATQGDAQGARQVVADARLLEGSALVRQGRVDEAIPLFEQARTAYEEAGDRSGVARTLNSRGTALVNGREWEQATPLLEEGLAIARAIGSQDLVARLLNNLAILERRRGDLQSSLTMNEESLLIRREIGDRTNIAISLNNIGNVLLDLGDFDGASRHYEESADMSRETGDRSGLARALRNASEALLQQAQIVRARTLSEEALAIRRGIDDPASLSSSLYSLGRILSLEGRLSDAKRRLAESLDIERQLDNPRGIAFALFEQAEIALLEADFAAARRLHEEALAIRTQDSEPITVAASQAALAVLALEESRLGEAEAPARQAVAGFASLKDPAREAEARTTLVRVLLALNRIDDARREMADAQSLTYSAQYLLIRLPIAIVAARLDALADPAAALQALESLRTEATNHSLARWAFEAHRAIVEIEEARSPTAGSAVREALRRDALAKGLPLYAR